MGKRKSEIVRYIRRNEDGYYTENREVFEREGKGMWISALRLD